MKYIYVIAAILVLAVMIGCSQEQPDVEAPQAEETRTVNVETTRVEPRLFESYLRMVGTVAAQNDVRISAEVAGRIEQYFVDNGDIVQKGQAIVKIDDAQLLQEKARLEALTEQSRENYERLQRLYEQEQVGSEIDYLNARYAYQQNKASLESVEVSLEKTTVRAPFNATVENILVEEGEMANPGTVLVRLIGVDRLNVTAGVPARFSEVVDKGDSARVWFDSQQGDTLRLPITFVGQSIDPQARTFRIEIALPASGRNYKTDMIANVLVKTVHRDDALVVGEEFIYQKENGFVVYTVDQDENGTSVARERLVRLGPAYNNNVVIAQGLNPGDRVITVGSSFLQDDMRIKIVEKKQDEFTQRISED